MSNEERIKQGQPWLMPLLMTLFVLLLSERASATYVDDTYRYMVTLNGSNTIRIKAPVYDQDGADCWVTDGNLKVKWKDDKNVEHEATVFHWQRNGDTDDDSQDIYIHFRTDVGGSIEVTQGNSSNHFTLTKEDGDQVRLVYRNNDGRTFDVTAVWHLPYDMLGKTLSFSWDVMRDGNGRNHENVRGLGNVDITMPKAQDVVTPQLTMATISYSETGKLEVPWFIASTKLQSAKYEYIDGSGATVTKSLPADVNSGTIYLDATVPHDNFHIVVSYKDNDDYLIENISSATLDLTMIHAPIGLSAIPLGGRKASVQLTWNIQYPEFDDLTSIDYFEIQRSLSGKEADFESIGMVPFAIDKSNLSFSFVDSTLIDAISSEMLIAGGTLDKLTYRVRRSITQNWGWEGNPCAKSSRCVVDDIHLLRIASYSAQWEDEKAYTVRVSWDYDNGWNAVWDDKAKLKLKATMLNGEGLPVDSMLYTLSPDEYNRRYKVVNFSRPCLDYKIEVYAERNTSPIHLSDDLTSYFFPIYTEADWKAFRDSVAAAQGKRDVNARLYADISTDLTIGENLSDAYRGTFDGNGHTLNVNITRTDQYVAPFRYVGNANIRNLHVTGDVSSNQKFAAGLVATIAEKTNLIVENCRVSATISSMVNGDATNGGIVANAAFGTLTLRNCQFDGSMKGSDCYMNGGLVGWGETLVTIENCLFSPESITTKLTGCQTYARHRNAAANLRISNSYATILYEEPYELDQQGRFVIRTDADWDKFCRLVANAKGNANVNAVLENDISINNSVGKDSDAPFMGTFDGNGHTLKANITGSEYAAPFKYAKGYTIRNLRVTGTISGDNYSSGLVGSSYAISGRSDTITNCRVSANVKCNGTHAGGFIGQGNSSNHAISNCLFDGSLSCTGDNAYGGAIIGWEDAQTHNVITNCLENGTYSGIAHCGMNYNKNTVYGNAGDSKNNWTYHNWGEVGKVGSLTAEELVEKLGKQNWKVNEGAAIPIMPSAIIICYKVPDAASLLAALGRNWKLNGDKVELTILSFENPTTTYPTPSLPSFYHDSIGKIDKKLNAQTRQSSVLLTWVTDGNPIDYFTVMRRLKGTGEEGWETIEPKTDQLSYEDKTVSPLEEYEYKVRATSDCEGISYTETDVTEGFCKHTGLLEGYVRFNDGTGVPNIKVEIVAKGQDGSVITVTTDESGHFMADELSYYNQPSIEYIATPVSTSNIVLEVTSYSVTFNSKTNHEQVHEFVITNGIQFNAYVMYDGTSIPVKGVRFKVNNQLIHDATGGLVETDYEGHATFNVLRNTLTTIQTVMDKHVFTNGGYYKSAEGVTLTDKVGQAYFYDSTLVKLTGRVVGGTDQGNLPLDHNLSKNNLGRDLTMVLTLEGDNTSWLLFDNQNPALTTRNICFEHPAGGGHKTTVEVQRKRLVVKPDSLTGEYVLMLPPVRWKAQQIYCDGYSTLFQDGQVSEIIDLTNRLTPDTIQFKGTFVSVDSVHVYQPKEIYNYRYNRIYRAPLEISYRQLGYDTFDYFGDKEYEAQTLGGTKVTVPLAYLKADTVAYTFKHPVFSLERRYPILISVVERYPWNGVKGSKNTDVVHVGGGKVSIHNGLKNDQQIDTLRLDSLGQGIFTLKAEQTTRLLTGENALKTVTMTLEQDGTTYEATPLKAYVLNAFATGASKDVLMSGHPMLIDILRDPPGGSSTATLSKGSKLKLSYNVDMKFEAGVGITIGRGTEMNNYSGLWAGTSEYGIINSGQSIQLLDIDVIFSGSGKKAYSYTMNVGEDITTSSSATMVGADADLYMGVVQNIVVTPMSTIRAIPDSIYQQMQLRLGGEALPTGNQVKYGTMVEIAKGIDGNNNLYHLIRDESLGYGPEVTSQFIHSQKHIITEILPKLANEIFSMMFTGTKEQAQTLANQTGKPVYWSKVPPTHENFLIEYEMIMPTGQSNFSDEVQQKMNNFDAWVQMIVENECEKLNASNLLANYDVDGGTKVNYSETFESEFSQSINYNFPYYNADYFGTEGHNAGDIALTVVNDLWMIGQTSVNTLISWLLGKLSKNKMSTLHTDGTKSGTVPTSLAVNFGGRKISLGIKPVADYKATDTKGTQHNFSRKESFSLSMDNKSHLNVDVYRVMTKTDTITDGTGTGNFEVFYNNNYDTWFDFVNNHVKKGIDYSKVIYPRSFVYRTRGGSTCNPWEDARYTQAYHPGTLLDERTKKICNPKIMLDRQSVSGVPIGDPARFKVYLTNESEQPEAATGGLTMFTFYLDSESNPNGAKLYVDGAVLTGNGLSVALYPGKVLEKTLEVYAGNGFDFEGLTIGVASSSDFANTMNTVKFDVHFLREAGPVNISTPGDKWVMNTNASFDDERGWFLPVTIDGFNKYQHNFDHIEFQYKESLHGDDAWTNLCSYFADSTLLLQANGMCAMIPENGKIKTSFYGEGIVMEQAYDLRAVLYCRNGNSFLTTASKIVSGVKDTRRPQLFGTPEPKSGQLNMGDNIVFNFSEDIEYNYLNAKTNFEVKGEVNNDDVSESVSIQFVGKSSVESEARRNFSGKDLTIDLMVKPDETGSEMPLFSHGTNGKKLQLWLTKDFHLKAVIDDQEYTSEKAIAKGGFTQVAMSISTKQDSLIFYNGGERIGTFSHIKSYKGTGKLIFGRTNENDRMDSKYYKGRMMEARLWYRFMTGGLIGTTYGSKRLTGYELGLVDYYPMNEGSGDYAIDHAQGANAQLINASWARPRGLSLRLQKEDHGRALTQNALNRTSEQDYTLMFWFKTDAAGRGVLVSNGAGSKTEIGAENIFNLGFEAEKLLYKTKGMQVEIPGNWSDGQWHHLAFTVNRMMNVANIYVDQTLRTTFATDSLGGISGGHPLIGAALYTERDSNGHEATIDTRRWLAGNIDELCLFAQALPLTLIQKFATRSPKGDEAGLLAYLSFDRQERQKDNDLELVAYPYSKKIYLDDKGEVRYELDSLTKLPTSTPLRDYLFVDPMDEIINSIDSTTAAPMIPYEELKNLTFDFVGEGHKVLVNLKENNARLNRRNIYVTVREVEDKNGNAMASPQTACYFVTNSSIQWLTNRLSDYAQYGYETMLEMSLMNNSATKQTYKIENCPRWLTLDKYTDILDPLASATIKATVSKDLNVGSYDEIIYVTDEEGVSEPLYLNLTVEALIPDWAWSVSSDLLENSMNISGKVYINDEVDIDTRDIVGVFDRDNVCHGFSNVSYSAATGESNIYLTVYDSKKQGRDLYFKLWQYSTGRELVLLANNKKSLVFKSDSIMGVDDPVRFTGGDMFVQTFDLKKGWNWLSFNVQNEALNDLNNLLDGLPWQEGDILTEINGDLALLYTDGHWLASENPDGTQLSPKNAYAIKVQQDIQFPIGGRIIMAEDQRTIFVKSGWNGIGYTPMINLSVETALSDYYDKAEPGDVIKSHDQFAYFTISGGVGRWRGNLEYMKPGEGYMMLRKAKTSTSFRYPFYEPGSTYLDEWTVEGTSAAASSRARSTMSVSAMVEGFEVEEGDRLLAFVNGEVVGNEELSLEDEESASAQSLFYLSISGDEEAPIWFAIERDGEIIASTDEQMNFRANAIIGSPDQPALINFLSSDIADGKWYTISGIQLAKRPTVSGVYIFNGKKVVIK